MTILSLKNKNIAVLGYGIEGRAITAYLLKNGIKPAIYDQRPWEEWGSKDKERLKKLELNVIFGPDCLKELAGMDIAFRSPGIWRLSPELLKAEKKGLKLTSQTSYFFDNCPAKIIGITGTKGKGTTATLIYEILRQNFKSKSPRLKIVITGNIGKKQPLEIMESLTDRDWVVYELSSFQLQDLNKSPHIGVALMVTSEHLDVHKNQEEYLLAKSAITKFQSDKDFSVINFDFENSKRIGCQGSGAKRFFSTETPNGDCFFGKDGCIHFLQFGTRRWNKITGWALKGLHNVQNICAAILASDSAGCSAAAIERAVLNFQGLEHRLEFVTEKSGIKFYNDSFSTVPETAIAAIKSFGEPLILILGGSSKKSDFKTLAQVVFHAGNIKKIILVGLEASRLKRELLTANFSPEKILEGASVMSEIFSQIKTAARPGDSVLLSPACASFDMFKNYQDRGQQFKKFALQF